MPGLVRKILIFSTLEGLILQSYGSTEPHKTLYVSYKSRKISDWTRSVSHLHHGETRLESHGIIGFLNVASLSFLIAITGREQVAQIYGRPVFVITDVALLPISTHEEVREAIAAASKSRSMDEELSDTDLSDNEPEHPLSAGPEAITPFEDDITSSQKRFDNTKIAEDVARGTASYGKFASEWFSRRAWMPFRTPAMAQTNVPSSRKDDYYSRPAQTVTTEAAVEAAPINHEAAGDIADKSNISDSSTNPMHPSTMSLLPKLLRSTKMILSSRSFYFSYDYDLTRRLALMGGRPQLPSRDSLDPLYFWNRKIGTLITEAGQSTFLMPIMQGFVGQRTFTVKAKSKSRLDDNHNGSDATFLLTLISRRSTKRSGLRYLRRGIDDEGNCANSVETEQILSSPTWDRDRPIRSFVQTRGSIPLYFSQSPYSFKPVPTFHNSAVANQTAFKRHFQSLKERYGAVQIVTLVDKHGTEATIGGVYENLYRDSSEAGGLRNVDFEWFDFHAECRGMKFENVERLVTKLKDKITMWNETVIVGESLKSVQAGIIRTNCMDCLDRTNVAQSAFGQYNLQRNIEEQGFEIDLLHDESTNWFNTLWADNGDAISRQYASTAALKGDFTRTRKRNWQGAVNDLGLTLSRYYNNMVNDYFSQAVIDVLIGNVSWKIFEDFESTLMSADPGVSVLSAREAAIENSAKIVIQNKDEDLIHGWTLLSPARENTLRTLPLEETVVLLTDAAVYCCKFDWNTEKVASFEKVDLKSIVKIRYGTYVTSTFSQRQTNEELNQGLVVIYRPGKDDVIRINTRSLQNSVSMASRVETVDGGTGLLSWFTLGSPQVVLRTMALKVIAHDTTLVVDDAASKSRDEAPRAMAEHISEEIQRAIEGSMDKVSESDIVEEGDIISAADARQRTGYLEQLSHSLKRMVWA